MLYTSGVFGVVTCMGHQWLGMNKVLPQVICKTKVQERLIKGLWTMSTVYWLSASALILATPTQVSKEARPYVANGVAAVYMTGGFGNFWCTQKLHPGGLFLSCASVLAFFGGR